ncbi:hypothetical protein VKT23_007842 [Stygiomarasmius scandens]|uniref:Uncharacterized protein n=1 Tax=Marasmiellus scandens TaxID=2682957 RepID=A0ABR1JJ56_9AGAR
MIHQWDPGILWDDYGVRTDFQPFTFGFPRADIHELLSPDLLHQLIKGTFKDHIVTWINELIIIQHGQTKGDEIIDDIDRLAAIPSFPGIRHFADGRDFKQWTGNDSKALMKIYIPAIKGYVPSDVIETLRCFLDFCYTVWQNLISVSDLKDIKMILDDFHRLRQVFVRLGVRSTISLPRQHAMKHYPNGIRLFGAPAGLCSSITESKHIESVKETWRRANNTDPLPQMLTIITRLDQMSAVQQKFERRGMLKGTVTWYAGQMLEGMIPALSIRKGAGMNDDEDEDNDNDNDEDEDEDNCGPASGPKAPPSFKLAKTREFNYPANAEHLGAKIRQPALHECIRRYLADHLYDMPDVPLEQLPQF